jgi:C-terminal processing protease CtpA/Prc
MQSGRGWMALALLQLAAAPLMAQEGSSDAEARSRELAERMRVTLEQQARTLSRMQRDLERASRADSRVRDSIVRTTSQRIAELASEIARVQMEADHVQHAAVDAQTRAQLQAQIASSRAMANVTRALAGRQRALIFSTRSMPRGYLGVTLSGEQNTELRDEKVFTVFLSPSVIASVEAGSPAAESGLEAGDTIVAFGRLPVPGAVPLADVMTPGEKLPIKIRRQGRERVLTVLVGERTSYSWSTSSSSGGGESRACASENCSVTGAGQLPRFPAPPGPPAPASGGGASATAPLPPGASIGTPNTPRVYSWNSTDYAIAGAVMTTITDELEDLTGVDEGILVLRVAPGTPASTSGLRGGDVIIRVNDDDCEGVRDLQVAVQRATSRGMRRVLLVVSRKQKEQSLTLQW